MKIDWSLFSFPFADPRWKGKAAIGGLLALVGTYLFIPFFWLLLPVMGYGFRIMRRTVEGEPPILPEWDNWSELFGDGLRVWVVGFVYSLPITLIVCCFYAVLVGSFISLGALSSQSRSAVAALPFGFLAMEGLIFLMIGIMFLLAIPTAFMVAGAMTRLAATDSLARAFDLGEVYRFVRRGLKNYALALIVIFGVLMAVSLVSSTLMYTFILACLYPFVLAFGIFYLQVITNTLYGMAHYQTALPAGAAPAPAPAPAPLPKAKDTDPLLKTDPLLAKPDVPASAAPPGKTPAPRKRRASTPRKKKPGSGEGGS